MSATHYTKIAPTMRLNVRTACGRRSVTFGAMTSPLSTTTRWERVTCKACLDKKPALLCALCGDSHHSTAEHAAPLDAIYTDL